MILAPRLRPLADLFLVLVLAFASGIATSQAANDPSPLPQEGSDIAADPSVTWGVLPNGLRYAILPNAEPPDRVSMRLFVDAGSLMESEDQRGLAHFLEHMAFNGTKNFPPGEMVEYFQRLGMGFGNHTNAHTSFRETVYKLELPSAEEALLDEGMKLLRDYADGMLLLQEEIDDERGIILSEKRGRDSVEWRTFVDQMKFILPNHLLADRMPIGTEEVITGAQRDRFVDFYQKYYTANRMAVVVVGSVTVPEITKLIETHFASLEAKAKTPDPDLGPIAQRSLDTHYYFEKEAAETTILIEAVTPLTEVRDDAARRAEDLRVMIATSIIDRRLERLAKATDSPIKIAKTGAGDFFDLGFARYLSIEAECPPQNWQAALTLIEQELRRAIEHGFTEGEYTEATANIQQRYEDAAAQMGKRLSSTLANQIADRIGSRRLFTSPAEDLPRVSAVLAELTPAACQESLAKLWTGASDKVVLLSGNVEIAEADKPLDLIKSVYDKSLAIPVTAPEDKALGTFSYSELPAPGVIAEQKLIEDLGVTQVRFENQVRVNLKPTEFEDETIHVKVRFGPGLITEPKAGLSFFLSSIFANGGLEAHDYDEIQRLFAGQSVSLNFSVDDDAFSLGGKTTPADFAQQLTLLRAFLTNPGFREEAALEFRRSLDAVFQQIERTPGGFAQDDVATLLHGGGTRFGFPPRAELDALTTDEAKAWIAPSLASGYCEVTIVGDFDVEIALKDLAVTFGNLPAREAAKPPYTEERRVNFPAPTKETFTIASDIPKGMVVVQWPTESIFDIQRTRRLSLLSAVLDDRLRVKLREELGDTYSPVAHNLPSDTWTDYGYLFALVEIDPPQAAKVTEVITEISKELAGGTAITEDELTRAKAPQITSIEEMRRTNRYWLSNVLEASQEHPGRLDWARSFVDDYKSISLDDLNQLAKNYLSPDKAVAVTIVPAQPE